jgi:uncharacterized protein with HEPN domain
MPLDRDIASLFDMWEAAGAIAEFCRGKTYAEYLASRLLRSAVERQIEIIGEAARRVSAEFKKNHPEIPWQPVMVQRHIIAHNYDVDRDEKNWRVVTIHAPNLMALLQPLLPPPPSD